MQSRPELLSEMQSIEQALDQLSLVLSESEYEAMFGALLQHREQLRRRLASPTRSLAISTGQLIKGEDSGPQRVFEAWSRFVNRGEPSDAVSPMVLASWKRCYAKVNPVQAVNPVRLNQVHLLSSQVASFDLISVARPIMEDVYQLMEKAGVAILLTNSAGCVLDRVGSGEVVAWLDAWGVTPGAILSEELLGTNAVGLALAERTPTEVIGAEHYLHPLHRLAGAAAPMFDLTGRLLGVLGILMPLEHYHVNYMATILASARAIEGQRQADVLMAEQNSQLTQLNTILATISDGILVWNAQRTLLHANPAASRILDVPVESLLGRSIASLFQFPPFVYEAVEQHKPLADVEITINYGKRGITCMANLDFVFKQEDLQWIIVTLRDDKPARPANSARLSSSSPLSLDDISGDSPQIQQVRNFARSAARARASVLIRGETGTGKNTLSNAIHNISPRREGPFVTLACSSVPADLLARELFGYEEVVEGRRPVIRPSKFELAQGGTLFLQDVDALPLELQAVLMNVVESGKLQPIGGLRTVDIDVRVMAATQKDIEKMVGQGAFRADLYYWLSTLMVTLPALRERPRDIVPIAERMLKRVSAQWGMPRITLQPGVVEVFKVHTWPGNLREMEAVLGRATAQLGSGTTITLGMLPASVRYAVHHAPVTVEAPSSPVQSLHDIERQTILRTAQLCRGNVSLMARSLQISRTTLWRRMREFGIYPKDYRSGARDAL